MKPALLCDPVADAPAGAGTAGSAEIVLDLSRLLSRILHGTPTGIDRVEHAYARTLALLAPDRVAFAATHPLGAYGRLDPAAVARFLAATARRWEAQDDREGRSARPRRHVVGALLAMRPRAIPRPQRRRVVLQVSPNGLEHPSRLAARLAREEARFLCLVHDLIPIAEPAFARRDGPVLHGRRMAAIAQHADLVIANSQATGAALAQHWQAVGARMPRIDVLPLAVEPPRAFAPVPTLPEPYFLCLGTIEPRKNHLLLLHLWRRMAETAGGRPLPKLVLIGRRGWENQSVFQLLDRCRMLAPHVRELGRLPDRAVAGWLAGARALLMPSFAEGFGLPVAEALAAGTPVLASDLPAHREAGGDLARYLDPLDGPGWHRAILEHLDPEPAERRAQRAKAARARLPGWESHVARALALAEEVARS
jgi:glycosyltransferase involved in cell wall biosynthesis